MSKSSAPPALPDKPESAPAGHEPVLIARLQPDGIVVAANPALCEYLGLAQEDLLGRPFANLLEPADHDAFNCSLGTLSAERRASVIEARAAGARTLNWVRWTLVGVFHPADRLLEIHCLGRDIAHERQAEEDSARLAAIVAGAEDGIVSKTLEGIVTSWNPGAEAMFGYTAAEAVGRSIALIIPLDRLHEEVEILARLGRGEKTEHFETQRMHKSGRLLWVSVNVSPVRDDSGRLIGASKIVRDIDQQRRTQAALEANVRSLESLYRLAEAIGKAGSRQDVYDAALEAVLASIGSDRASILMLDPAGIMRFVAWRGLSDRYRRATEGHSPWRPDTVNPQPVMVEDVLSDASLEPLRDVIAGEGIRSLGFLPLMFQGRLLGKFMVYFDQPRGLSAGDRQVADVIVRHVAFGLARVDAVTAAGEAFARERKARSDADAAREEAERASRAKDEFLAMLAHELRNPLSVIVHAIHLLGLNSGLPSETRRSVSMLDRQSRHLSALLDDLLDVARITSGRIQLRSELVDLRAIVNLAAEAQRIRISEKDQSLGLMLPPESVVVRGDPVRLQQVVGNLVHNATKYTAPGGSIRIELEADGPEAVVRVRDNGIGLPADRLESIFELFVQGNPSLARTEGGLGIGLTLVKRVVALHDGKVLARSAGPGQGSEFEVRLPLARDPKALPPSPEATAPVPKPSARRVLVVEDNADGREALVSLLRLKGHEVFEAGGGSEALRIATDQRPEVVLLDIGLPDMDGYQVARALRSELGARVRLVALTGYGQPADQDRAREVGFEVHLVKPVDVKRILKMLEV